MDTFIKVAIHLLKEHSSKCSTSWNSMKSDNCRSKKRKRQIGLNMMQFSLSPYTLLSTKNRKIFFETVDLQLVIEEIRVNELDILILQSNQKTVYVSSTKCF